MTCDGMKPHVDGCFFPKRKVKHGGTRRHRVLDAEINEKIGQISHFGKYPTGFCKEETSLTRKFYRAQLEAPGKSTSKVVNMADGDRLHHGRLSSKISLRTADLGEDKDHYE